MDTAMINKMNGQANALWSSHPDSMIIMSKRILATCDSLGYTAGKIDALQNLGIGYYEKGNYNESIQHYNRSVKVALKAGNMEREARIYSNLAMPYIALGKHKEALVELNKAIDASEKYNLPWVKAHATHNIGMVYHYQQMEDSAISYYTRSQQQYEKLGDTSRSTFILGNIGHIFLAKRDFKRAKECYVQSLKLAKILKNYKAIGNAQQSLGALFLETKDWKNARYYFLEAKKSLESTGEKTEYLRLLDNLSEFYLDEGDATSAARYAEECYQLAQANGQMYYLQSSAKKLSDFFERKKNLSQSLAFYKIYKSASDSLYSKDNKEQLVRQEEEFRFKKQQGDMEAVYTAKVWKRNYILAIALVLILSMSVIGFLLLRNIRQTRKNNKILKSTNAFIEEQILLLEDSDKFKKSLISIIAHDIRSPINSLHYILKPFKDGILSEGQTRKLLSSCYDEIDTLTIHIENLLLWASQHLHTFDLSVANFNIKELFKDIVRFHESRLIDKQIRPEIDCDPQLSMVADPEVVKIIVRNLVDNAIKYSLPGEKIRLEARVSTRGDSVIFSIVDTGIGLAKSVRDKLYLDANPISLNGTSDEEGFGLGLQLCMYYLELCHSELRIQSIEGEGSIFSFELQLQIT
jgi:Signal transduction histidine kinase